MRGLFGSLTTRGRSFMAAGGAAVVCGLAIPEPDLVRVGALLIILPAVSALIARRSRYRLSCARRLDPPRVPAGQPATVTARVENVSRLRTGVLLAEDVTPYTLGSRPRVPCSTRSSPAGAGSSTTRSVLTPGAGSPIGPLRVRVADALGWWRSAGRSAPPARSWSRRGSSRCRGSPRRAAGSARATAGCGRSRPSARTTRPRGCTGQGGQPAPGALEIDGEIRRADGPPRGTPVAQQRVGVPRYPAFCAFGQRHASTFETAVSAAASIGAHLSGEGFRARLITEAGEIAPRGTFHDSLLDMLAVITPSGASSFGTGTSTLASAGGQLIAVVGRVSARTPASWPRAGAGTRPRWRCCSPSPRGPPTGSPRTRRGRRRSFLPRDGGWR